MGLKALDEKTRLEFETEQIETNFPKFEDLVKFVRHKCAIMDLTYDNSKSNQTSQPSRKAYHITTDTVSPVQTSVPSSQPVKKSKFKCSVCTSGDHRIASCPKFLKMDISKRYNQVKDLKLCFACLSSTHSRNECQSAYRCKYCRSRNHHSLLHSSDSSSSNQPVYHQASHIQHSPANNNVQLNRAPSSLVQSSSSTSREKPLGPAVPPSQNVFSGNYALQQPVVSNSVVLLGTAEVQVMDKFGIYHPIRCILDSGSQISIISNRLAQQLKLDWCSSNLNISGIDSEHPVRAKGELVIQLLPHHRVAKPNTKPL